MVYQLTIDDFIGRWGYSKQYVRGVLDKYKGKHVDVKISSYGGDLDHGLDIMQQFRDHGDVTVYLSGFVASAATVMAMGAKRVCISPYAMFLVHKCSNFIDAWGAYNADQMQALIDDLTANKKENDKIDVVLANLYAGKCRKKVSDILDILKEGRWMTAKEAHDTGFVDEITDSIGDTKINFTPELRAKLNAFGMPACGLQEEDTPCDSKERKNLVGKIVNALFNHGGDKDDTKTDCKNMEKKSFKSVESLLKTDSINCDSDGNVTVSSADMDKINDRIASLEDDLSKKDKAVKDAEKKISDLNAQIEALKKAPGDDTSDVDDTDDTDSPADSANIFNSIKDCL